MDERKLAIIVGVALVLLIIMGFLLMPRKGSGIKTTDTSRPVTKKGQQGGFSHNETSGSTAHVQGDAHSQTVTSTGARVINSGGQPAENITGEASQAFSEEEMQEFRNNRDAAREKLYEKKLAWLSNKSKDPKLSAKSQVRYRLKLIEGFRGGNDALNNKDYAEAIKQYLAGVKDPDGCPVTRYVCFEQMRFAARMMKDYDLYLEILKEQAKLIESEELGVLGIDKSKGGYVMYERRKLFVQAAKGPDGLKQAVDDYMKTYKLKEEDREDAEKEFVEDFDEWKKSFDLPG